MNKPLALFDIDKTMFNGFSHFSLMYKQLEEGLLDPGIGVRAQNAMSRYKGQTLSYEDFVKEALDLYAEGLQSKTAREVENSADRFFRSSPDFFGYVRPTINLLLATHEVVIVTGSSQFTAIAVARLFGVQRHMSTQLGEEDGILNGRVVAYLATRRDKRLAVQHLVDTHPFDGSFGFGDSDGDIEMLQTVEHPICIRPTPGLAEIAHEQGWAVIKSEEDLASTECLAVVKHALPK